MKLRSRLDAFSTALLSALGASSLVACGGTAQLEGGGHGGSAGAISSGAGSSGVGLAGAASAGASAVNSFPCRNPVDRGGGTIECEGFEHRTEVSTCASKVPRPEPYPNAPSTASCTKDADCTAQPYGWCGETLYGDISPPYCLYGCTRDSDCGARGLCLCGEPVGHCVQAGCTSDADCAAGFLCKSYDVSSGCGQIGMACQSAADTCGSDADCAATEASPACQFDPVAQHFQCASRTCAIGRPFLVEGEARRARGARRDDWANFPHRLPLQPASATLSAYLVEQWTRLALLEHASIAAFARFSLQLLSLGAPSDLIERTTEAMADETQHAQACFAIASQYAGQPVGPGRLAIEHSLDDHTLREIVVNTIREGCVGETVAAIEAREAAEYVTDPALRALLLRISEDETRHAELAFRFVQWALSLAPLDLQGAVRDEFAALTLESASISRPLTALENDALRHGIAPDSLRRVVRERAIREVILPCAQALGGAPVRASKAAIDQPAVG